jgi:hypothetical protein
VSAEDNLGPCDCFTVLDSRRGRQAVECDVCDHIQGEHAGSGIRVLTGGEIEALRRRILMERYERRQQEPARKPDPASEIRPDGDPELH